MPSMAKSMYFSIFTYLKAPPKDLITPGWNIQSPIKTASENASLIAEGSTIVTNSYSIDTFTDVPVFPFEKFLRRM